jgi:peptidoglycan/LPS O-acetylase OafA/YrhL
VPAKRFHELDLLRFVAAVSVVLFHYSVRGYALQELPRSPYAALAPVTKYGFLGVNLFFIISGFVILMTAARASVRGFAVSRFVRLYPAFWICCSATFAGSWLVARSGQGVPVRTYLLNMTMVSGVAAVPAVDGVYWSLLVELKFYALVLLAMALRQMGRLKVLLASWLGLSLLSLLRPLPIVSTWLVPEWAPYFIAGATMYLASQEGLSAYKAAVIATCYALAVVGLAKGLPELEANLHMHISLAAASAVLAAFFGATLLVSTGATARFGSVRWMLFGSLTYPIYLLHQRLGYWLLTLGHGRANAHLVFWGVVAFVLCLAYLVTCSERLVAPPLRRLLIGERASRGLAAQARGETHRSAQA